MLFGCLLLLSACASVAEHDDRLVGTRALLVAGAADLRPAFEELGVMFTEETGHEVTFDFGSSGQLAQRIIEGAPVDVYASANISFVDAVLDAGRGDPDTKATYAFGRIALWSPADMWGGWEALSDVVGDPGVTYLAIANPEHAPYGLAAREALEGSGLWDVVEPKLVYGENISETLRLTANGDADAAIVALSLAIAFGDQGVWVLIDEALHNPLEQALVVVSEDPERVEVARAFASLVNSPGGRDVMTSYGFVLPGEESG